MKLLRGLKFIIIIAVVAAFAAGGRIQVQAGNAYTVGLIKEIRGFTERVGNNKEELKKINDIISKLRTANIPLTTLGFEEIVLVSEGKDGGIDIIKGEPYTIKLVNRVTGENIQNSEIECFYVDNTIVHTSFLPGEAVGGNFLAQITTDGTITARQDITVTSASGRNFELLVKYKNAFYLKNVRILTEKEAKVENEKRQIEQIENNLVEKYKYLSDVEKVLAVHDYLIDHIRYGYDPNDSLRANGKQGALLDGLAVCEGYANSFYDILKKLDVNVKSVTGYMGNVLHKWNMVELDREWYFVDVTGDDGYSGTNTSASSENDAVKNRWKQYKYFLVNAETLRATHSINGNMAELYNYGNKYTSYVYEKEGIKVESIADIDSVVKKLYNRTNDNEFYVGVYAKSELGDISVKNALKAAVSRLPQSATVDNSKTSPTSSIPSAYKLHYELVKLGGTSNAVAVNAVASVENSPTNTVKLILDAATLVDTLTANNISVGGASLREIQTSDNINYYITFDKITSADGNISLKLHKRNYVFADVNNVNIGLSRFEKPDVSFEAADTDSGVLKNLNSNVAYQIGNSGYVNAGSESEVLLTGLTDGAVIKAVDIRNADRDTAPKTVFRLTVNAQPDYIYAVASVSNGSTGEILGVSPYMEYKKSDESSWRAVSGRTITDLAAGTYLVRKKAYKTFLASVPLEVRVEGTAPETPAVNPAPGTSGGGNAGSAAGGGTAGGAGGFAPGAGSASGVGGAAFGGGAAAAADNKKDTGSGEAADKSEKTAVNNEQAVTGGAVQTNGNKAGEISESAKNEYVKEVQFVLEKGLMSNNKDGNFVPEKAVKISSFSKIIAKLSGIDTKNKTAYKTWLKESGLLAGIKAKSKNLSFRMTEKILKNYKKFLLAADTENNENAIVSEITTKQEKALRKFLNKKMAAGKNKAVTRGELSRILYLLAK